MGVVFGQRGAAGWWYSNVAFLVEGMRWLQRWAVPIILRSGDARAPRMHQLAGQTANAFPVRVHHPHNKARKSRVSIGGGHATQYQTQ